MVFIKFGCLQPVGGLICPTMHLGDSVVVTSFLASGENSQWVGRAVVLLFASPSANYANNNSLNST